MSQNEDDLIFQILEKKLHPNELLKDAVKEGNLSLVKIAMEYGACITSLTNGKSVSDYLNTLNDELSSLLALYGKGENGDLSLVAQELSAAMYSINNINSINRNETYEQVDKIHHWSIGLITRELEDTDYLTSLNQISNISDWSDRFSNVSSEKNSGFYVVSTVTEDAPIDIDPQYISANITGRFHVFMVDAYSLKEFIGSLTLQGGHEFIGIDHTEAPDLFLFDGRIDSKIFDHMKNSVSAFYQNNQG
jgi:hypothetical protein